MPYLNIETTTVVTVCRREFYARSFGGDMFQYEDSYSIVHDSASPTPWGWGWQHTIDGRASSFRRPCAEYETLTEALDAMCRFAAPNLTPDTKMMSEDEIMKHIV